MMVSTIQCSLIPITKKILAFSKYYCYNKETLTGNSKETENFLEEFDKMDIDDISPRQSLDFLYKLKLKRQGNGKSKFKK